MSGLTGKMYMVGELAVEDRRVDYLRGDGWLGPGEMLSCRFGNDCVMWDVMKDSGACNAREGFRGSIML